MHERLIILDFGGQYAHLIASRIRRENVLAEIVNPDEINLKALSSKQVKGLILSGGPQSVFDVDSPKCDNKIFELGIPILGICYGHQYLNSNLGGEVKAGKIKEYGPALVKHTGSCPIFKNIPEESVFWMSHGDEVIKLASGFKPCGNTDHCKNAAVWNRTKNLFGIQFHPEVTHSEYGHQILKNFLEICNVSYDWSIEKFLEEETNKLKKQVGNKNVFLFVSGGVDSTVAFALLSKVLDTNRVKGLFVNTGLLRQGEVEEVQTSLKAIGTQLTTLEETETFLHNLKEIYDPEKKREIIGNTFLEVQQKFFNKNKLDTEWILAQGTIYPDTIETGGTKNAAKIKTHHNRVPEIQKLIDEGQVIEPIADLYKDEVRALGELLGLPHHLVWRHPFPGPGLGVRILCTKDTKSLSLEWKKDTTILPIKSVGVQGDFRTYRHPEILLKNGITDLPTLETRATIDINSNEEVNRVIVPIRDTKFKTVQIHQTYLTQERIERLQKADHIITTTLRAMNLYESVWQFPTVLLPISFDKKGKESIVLRPIDSIDAMSASVGKLPWKFFEKVTEEIMKDKNIGAVFLDVTSKPPGTIEWE